MLYKIVRTMNRREFNPVIISLMEGGALHNKISDLGIDVYSLKMKRGIPLISNILDLRRIVAKIEPHIIHGWMYHANLAATLARSCAPKKTPLVWSIRQSLYDLQLEKFLTRQVIRVNRFCSRIPDKMLYNSLLSQKQHQEYGLDNRKGQVIPNGVDTALFCSNQSAKHLIRSQLKLPREAPVIGHAARYHPMKDHQTFLRAATQLATRNPKVHFILMGREVSFKNEELRQWIPSDIQNRFHLLGECQNIPELMNAMDIFCQSSLSEAFPNVLCEAMATNVPCVATNVGDSATIIGDTGTLVPPRDPNALTAGLESMLNITPTKRQKLGERARSRIEKNYSLENIVEQYTVLYRNLIERKGT